MMSRVSVAHWSHNLRLYTSVYESYVTLHDYTDDFDRIPFFLGKGMA